MNNKILNNHIFFHYPYQTVDKILSKYFSKTETPSTKITFSICESTRKSKVCLYLF
jgi:hypothetical protein